MVFCYIGGPHVAADAVGVEGGDHVRGQQITQFVKFRSGLPLFMIIFHIFLLVLLAGIC